MITIFFAALFIVLALAIFLLVKIRIFRNDQAKVRKMYEDDLGEYDENLYNY